MAKTQDIKVVIKNFEEVGVKEHFYTQCAIFWKRHIENTIDNLDISYEEKVKLANEVLENIHSN